MKRTKEGAQHIQVRRINRKWCVVTHFNVNYYNPICTGCAACEGLIPALKDFKHSSDSNKRVKRKVTEVLHICDTRSEANKEADLEGVWEEQSSMAWSDVWNDEF